MSAMSPQAAARLNNPSSKPRKVTFRTTISSGKPTKLEFFTPDGHKTEATSSLESTQVELTFTAPPGITDITVRRGRPNPQVDVELGDPRAVDEIVVHP